MFEGEGERSLKFSIDKILSPEFGKNEKECRKNITTNVDKYVSHHRHNTHNSRSHPLDVSSLINKRKHSSDSESSSLSSFSTTSRDTFNNNVKDYSNGHKDFSNGHKDFSNGHKDPAQTTDEPKGKEKKPLVWPAWVYCTRYSDRPSSGESLLF